MAYGGGADGSGARGLATVRNWAAYNGCTGAVWDPQSVLDLDLTLPGLDTTVLRYTNCPPGGVVELWTINGGTHVALLDDGTSRSGFSTGLIDWLLAHPKP
jgi:poly(3-hydroxybutyrate) depolymerase